MIRVLLVDDNAMVRMGLSVFLETCDRMELLAEAENGQEAIELTNALQPDLILMDLVMPVMDGISATRVIHQQHPHIPILILTSTVDYDLIQQAHEAGAVGYVLKTVTIDELEARIHSVTVS